MTTGVDVNLLERAKYLGPDLRGRVRLLDENGKTIALLPLDEAYRLSSKLPWTTFTPHLTNIGTKYGSGEGQLGLGICDNLGSGCSSPGKRN